MVPSNLTTYVTDVLFVVGLNMVLEGILVADPGAAVAAGKLSVGVVQHHVLLLLRRAFEHDVTTAVHCLAFVSF